ncbi:hypothetical protein GEMRC1_001334 [Eukaryota sp. GEM-RC1]
MSENIEVYARVRPYPQSPDRKFVLRPEDNTLEFHVPRESTGGLVNNSRENWNFTFTKIFGEQTQQDEIFEVIGRKMINSVIDGYNSTTFAYGQTSSGKTYTLTGPPDVSGDYESRGLIPRSLSTLFEEIEKKQRTYTISISYLELYNERAYDLLNPDRQSDRLEDLSKVNIREDDNGRIVVPDLTRRVVNNLEDALDVLWEGDIVRVISSTPMNEASTRSHCIFTIHLSSKAHDSHLVRESKLNLVDLAGSERVGVTGVEGVQFREATSINLSLFYLEQVIMALSEKNKGRTHIPYRNSLLTAVLKDSLGGNCKTAMIATIAGNPVHINESLSTCSFAQRVSQIKNVSRINDSLDLGSVVKELKKENRRLKQEIALLRNDGERGPITESEKAQLKSDIEEFVKDSAFEFNPTDFVKIRASFEIFRALILERAEFPKQEGQDQDQSQSIVSAPTDESGRLVTLQELLSQRDFEIEVLVEQARKNEDLIAELRSKLGSSGDRDERSQSVAESEVDNDVINSDVIVQIAAPITSLGLNHSEMIELLEDKNRVYDHFKQTYYKRHEVEKDKNTLAQLYDQAKSIGREAADLKQDVEYLKVELQKNRAAAVAEGITDENEELLAEMNEKKRLYKDYLAQVKHLKAEITQIHGYMEKVKKTMQTDFKNWLSKQNELLQTTDTNDTTLQHRPRPASKANKKKKYATTGDPSVDKEIEKFYKVRQKLMESFEK